MDEEKDTKHNGFRVLFLSPTREGCLEFAKEVKKLDDSIPTNLNIGGTSEKQSIKEWDFASPEIVFSTPGRLLKFYKLSDYFENLKLIILNDPDQSFDKLNPLFKIIPSFSKKIIISPKEKEEFFKSLSREVKVEEEKEEEEKKEEENEDGGKVFLKEEDFVSMKLGQDEPILKEDIPLSSITQILDKIISISKDNLNLKIGIFLPTKYFVDYFYEVLKENDLYSFHYHGGHNQKRRILINTEFNIISNGILMTTKQLGYHLSSTKFDLVFTLNENEEFQYTKKIINFLPSEQEDPIENEKMVKLTDKNLKAFKSSFKQYLKYLNGKEEVKYFKLDV